MHQSRVVRTALFVLIGAAIAFVFLPQTHVSVQVNIGSLETKSASASPLNANAEITKLGEIGSNPFGARYDVYRIWDQPWLCYIVVSQAVGSSPPKMDCH